MNIFISGKPRCGKTTLILELINNLKGYKIAGILSPEIRKEKREGFLIKDLASGKEKVLASVNIKSKYKISKYGVSLENINSIVREFEKSFNFSDIIFIDEIGKMEFFSEEFRKMLNKILNSNKIVIATLHPSFIEKFRNKGRIFWLKRERENFIKERILNEIKMIKEKSVGAIVFRKEKNNLLYLLLYKKPSNHYKESWDFPKGNQEQGEKEIETAKREIKEESGIKDLNFVQGFREIIRFFYYREKKLIHKEIIFLLAETKQKEIKISYEHDNYKWLEFEKALKILTHKASKEILKKAHEFLKEKLKQKDIFSFK